MIECFCPEQDYFKKIYPNFYQLQEFFRPLMGSKKIYPLMEIEERTFIIEVKPFLEGMSITK